MEFCSNCEFELSEKGTENNIWDFEPRTYTSYKELFESLKRCIHDEKELYSKNEDGYTYFHWYIYFLGKAGIKYSHYYKKIFWFLDAIKHMYPHIFSKLLNEGTVENINYTCLHHLYKYCDNPNKAIVRYTEKYFIQNGVDPKKRDNEGFTYLDYKFSRKIPVREQKEINYYIGCYKRHEDLFFNNFFKKYHNHFHFCKRCGTEINFVEDLEKFAQDKIKLDIHEQFRLHIIIDLRERVDKIYEKYLNDKILFENHQYLVNIYKKILCKK